MRERRGGEGRGDGEEAERERAVDLLSEELDLLSEGMYHTVFIKTLGRVWFVLIKVSAMRRRGGGERRGEEKVREREERELDLLSEGLYHTVFIKTLRRVWFVLIK